MQFDLELAALTFDELISPLYEPCPLDEAAGELAQHRLKRWREISADGDADVFAKRLERQNLTEAAVLARFGGVRRRTGHPAPEWVADTWRIVGLLKSGAPTGAHDSVAFGPLLAPVIDDAAARLRGSDSAAGLSQLRPEAFAGIVDHLRQRLANLCELAFYDSLLRWRSGRIGLARAGDKQAAAELLADSLQPFAEHLRVEGYDALLRERPILFRLIAALAAQWIESYGEFLHRLRNDRVRLAPLLPGVAAGEKIDHVTWGLSDPHNGGRSVLSVDFGSGRRVLYKPKDLRADQFVHELIASFARQGPPEALVVPAAIAGDGYGWTAFVENKPCASPAEVEAYYRRFGAWLAVFHMLSCSDMHMENFIASGADPVPVDFEMILQGLRQRPKSTDASTEADWLASRFLEESVQSVGMLPAYMQGLDGALISMGALEPSVYPVRKIEWQNANTTRMLLKTSSEHVTIASNLPMLDGQTIGIAQYREVFIAGFESMLEFLRERAGVIAKAFAGIDAGLKLRRVLRPTRFYYMLLKRLYDHRRMDDAVLWSLEADFIARLYDWDEKAEQPWKLLASERRQLHRLGIPHFTMTTASNHIGDADGIVTRLHVDLGIDVAREREAKSSPDAITAQIGIVRSCLQLPAVSATSAPQAKAVGCLSFAQTLRDDIVSRAFRTEGSLAWLGLTRVDHEVAAQLGSIGRDLYYGTGGIALFLAALAGSGDADAAAQCKAAMAATVSMAKAGRLGRVTRALGIGGVVGLGSVVYALAQAGHQLDDGRMLAAAQVCARQLTDAVIADDDSYDVVAGAAGACLALLALQRRTPGDWIVDRAVACADHLLRHRAVDSGMWISSAFDRPLTGFAHGAGGIALAFSRVYAVTGDAKYRQAAQDCVAFENRNFDPAARNWIDLRADAGGGRTPNQWCYGAVGIGHARLAMLADGAVSVTDLTDDVERAITVTLDGPAARNDGLCCGQAGHVEFLAIAAARLDRPQLLACARQRAEDLGDRWTSAGDLRWIGGSRTFNPGLFQGLAGIGYAALRAAGSESPSPLLLD